MIALAVYKSVILSDVIIDVSDVDEQSISLGSRVETFFFLNIEKISLEMKCKTQKILFVELKKRKCKKDKKCKNLRRK